MFFKPAKKFYTSGIAPYYKAAVAGSSFVAGTAVAIQANGFAAGTLSFSSLNGGVNYPSGALVAVFLGNDQGADPVSPKIGTTALAKAVADSSLKVSWWWALLSGAETDTFTCTNGATYDKVGVEACYMTGMTVLGTTAPTAVSNYGVDDNPINPSTNPTIDTGGFGVAGLWSSTTGGVASPTWTNTTAAGGDINVSRSTTQQILTAHSATAGTWAPTANSNLGAGAVAWNFSCAMALATFKP